MSLEFLHALMHLLYLCMLAVIWYLSIILSTYLHDVRMKLTKTHVSMTGVQCGSRVWIVVMLGILDC